MNDYEFRDKLKECFDGDKGAYNQCMYEFQHRGLINNQLQSNWNSLREWLQEQNKFYEVSTMGYSYGVICNVLDKMNELEGKDNNEKV